MNCREAPRWLEGALQRLAGVVDDADAPPTRDARESYAKLSALVDEGRDGYLVIADRVLPASSAAPRVQRLGGGRVNGRAFSILAPL